MRRFVGGLVLALLVSSSVQAGTPQPVPSDSFALSQKDNPVDPFARFGFDVWNPTPCAWDFDDHGDYLRGGYLDPGTSATATACLIANENPLLGWSWAIHPNYRFTVFADRALSVTLCYQPGLCFPLSVIGSYRYEVCIAGPFYGHDSPLIQTIPDSNGGWGVPTTATLTVTNTSSRRIRDIYVQVTGGNDQDQCPGVAKVAVAGPDLATFWRQSP